MALALLATSQPVTDNDKGFTKLSLGNSYSKQLLARTQGSLSQPHPAQQWKHLNSRATPSDVKAASSPRGCRWPSSPAISLFSIRRPAKVGATATRASQVFAKPANVQHCPLGEPQLASQSSAQDLCPQLLCNHGPQRSRCWGAPRVDDHFHDAGPARQSPKNLPVARAESTCSPSEISGAKRAFGAALALVAGTGDPLLCQNRNFQDRPQSNRNSDAGDFSGELRTLQADWWH